MDWSHSPKFGTWGLSSILESSALPHGAQNPPSEHHSQVSKG